MEDFAARYFGPILLDYVGIPAEQVERVQQLEMDTFRTAENDADGSIRANAARELSSLLVNLVKRSRAELPSPDERTDSLLTFMLTEPMGDGTLMSDDEIKAALHIMCLGGAHSVKAAIGYTMKLLADRPALREQILADGQAGPNMIDELLRWNGVGGGMSFRTVAADTEIAGCPLHKGDTVCAMLTAANHDPKAAEDAGEIRFDRSTVKSFTFAFGTHRCLGINFAKMGVRVAVEEWLKRIPNFRVGNDEGNDEQTWAGVGYLALPLRWT
jgi:cytochrome P450